jgi:hypothetical protein
MFFADLSRGPTRSYLQVATQAGAKGWARGRWVPSEYGYDFLIGRGVSRQCLVKMIELMFGIN